MKSNTLSKAEIAHYSRHLILDNVGMEGQLKLKNAKVLCVGTGGLGSPLLMYLTAAGVGRIGIVDFVVVDESNLKRQILHGMSTVGKPKVQSAKTRLLDINPHIQIDVFEEPTASEMRGASLRPMTSSSMEQTTFNALPCERCMCHGKPNVYSLFLSLTLSFGVQSRWMLSSSRRNGMRTRREKAVAQTKADWLYDESAKDHTIVI